LYPFVRDAAAIGVDIPIGLVEQGSRDADFEVRKLLGARLRSSLFITPPRAVVFTEVWSEALVLAKQLMGTGISKQAFHLFPRIREVDTFAHDERILEVHPEAAFAAAKGATLAFSKKTWAGAMERRQLLETQGVHLPDELGPAGRCPIDDVLDAAIAAWSAKRFAEGQALRYPTSPSQHDRGRPIAIHV
jgi:predicted RNase H-like nuclease